MKKIICTLAILVGLTGPAYAKESIFYYCSASSEDNKQFYITELFQGDFKIISMTQNFQSHLKDNNKLESKAATCVAYGSKASPVKLTFAQKLWKLEVSKKQIMSDVQVLKWTPE